jgi:hypothetical protein
MPDDLDTRVLGSALVLTSLFFLSAGILWPQGAGAMLRIMLVVIAVGFIAARAHDALLLVRTSRQVRSPFDAGSTERTAPASPQVLRDLTDQLVAADDPRARDRAAVPWAVRRTLVTEATHRLAEHHGLDPADPGHHARIRTLVSAATWRLIAPAEPALGADSALRELTLILDDLERL